MWSKKFGRFSGQQEGLGGTIDMQHDIPKIKALLAKNEYQVTVLVTASEIVARFPLRLEPPMFGPITICYKYVDNGLQIVTTSDEGNIVEEQFIQCPVYATRLLLFSHIIQRCLAMNYTFAVAQFTINDDEDVGEEELYQACINEVMTPDDIALEDKLKPVVVNALFNSFTPIHEQLCIQNNVVEGYQIIKALMEQKDEPKPEEENIVDGGSDIS